MTASIGKRAVLRCFRKTQRDADDVTDSGRPFQARAAASSGNREGKIADRRTRRRWDDAVPQSRDSTSAIR